MTDGLLDPSSMSFIIVMSEVEDFLSMLLLIATCCLPRCATKSRMVISRTTDKEEKKNAARLALYLAVFADRFSEAVTR